MKTLISPIESKIQNAIEKSNSIAIAVPFLSATTVKRLFSKTKIQELSLKRIVIKLDESHSISYDLAAVKHLLECGFKIRFDNSIHLKLYILGERVFISSGNLTDGGLKNNFELTVETTEEESDVQCVFDDLWSRNKANEVTIDYVNENWDKYLFLKKKYPREKVESPIVPNVILSPDEETIINKVLFSQNEWNWHFKMISLVLKKRNKLLQNLSETGFKKEYFYTPEGHKDRNKSLFYEFVYGNEEKLAGTGLREAQFNDVFTDSRFEMILYYLYPQFKNTKSYWNLEDDSELLRFCQGLFEFDVRSFKEALPIRLANYFYPEHFLPIFNLSHLREICSILGFKSSATDRATRLCEYNLFLKKRLKDLPYNNFIKSTILYRLLYTLKVKREIDKNGVHNIDKFISKQKKEWVRNNMIEGFKLIKETNLTEGK